MPIAKPRLLIPLIIVTVAFVAALIYVAWPDPLPPATIQVPSGESDRQPRLPTAAPPLENLPEPAPGALMFPAKDSVPYPDSVGGQVFFVLDDDLYTARFDQKSATKLDDEVIPTSLHLSPDERTLLYQKRDPVRNYWQLFALNTETHAISKLDEHPNAFLDFEFSPDGLWVAYIQTAFPQLLDGMRDMFARRESSWQHTDQQLMIRRRDGKQAHVWMDSVYAKTWLADNTLLALYHAPMGYDFYPLRIVPDDGTPTSDDGLFMSIPGVRDPVERGVILIRARAELRSILATSEVSLAVPTNDIDPTSVAIAPTGESYIEIVRDAPAGACGLVSLIRRGYSVAEVPQLIFQARAPLDVRNPVWLRNDGLIFTLTEAPGCDQTRATTLLYFVAPFAEARPIARGLDMTTGADFAPSYDGRYALWAGWDTVTGQGYLELTNVLSGESSRVMLGTPGQHFGSLVWTGR